MASVQPAGPTPYNDDANTLLLSMLTEAQTVLRERLVGFYLYGSLSLGDFDPASSDIDFLIVTEEELSPPNLKLLPGLIMHSILNGNQSSREP